MSLADRLKAIDERRPGEIIRRALGAVQSTFEARLVAMVSARCIEGQVRCSPISATGDPRVVDTLHAYDGRHASERVDLERPCAMPVNVFERRQRADRLASLLDADALAVRRLEPCLDALIYDEDRVFLGWIFICAPGVNHGSCDGLEDTMNDVFRTLRHTLSRARDERRELFDQGTHHYVFDPSGAMVHASELADEWLEPKHIERLTALVDRMERDDRSNMITTVGGAKVSCTRMYGEVGIRYLAEVTQAEPVRLATDWQLTERQREVARLAATGMTTTEVGEELGIARNTVKKHLQNIYNSLGVGCRVELASRLDE